MDAAPPLDRVMTDQDRKIAEVIARERKRLGSFIRRRVPDPGDAEDILQDVFSELVESVRMLRPIEQVGAWLFQVARNRIIDRFRRRSARPAQVPADLDGEDGVAAGRTAAIATGGAGRAVRAPPAGGGTRRGAGGTATRA